MSSILSQTSNELSALASEFAVIRQGNRKKSFPVTLWQKAMSITQHIPAVEVCRAIHVHPSYFQKKMKLLANNLCEPPKFVEVLPCKSLSTCRITVCIESRYGHKLSIEGASASSLIPLLAEFLKGGIPCSK
jgi:hypothetical protein